MYNYGKRTLAIGLIYSVKFFSSHNLAATDWDDINRFAADVGWDIVFDLSMLFRNGTAWDSTNAQALMNYTKKKGYQIAGWELGNGRFTSSVSFLLSS